MNSNLDQKNDSVIGIYFRLIRVLGTDRPISFIAYWMLMIAQGLIPAVSVLLLADLFDVGARFLSGESRFTVFLLIAIMYAVTVQLIKPLINMAVVVMFKHIQRSLVASWTSGYSLKCKKYV